MGHPWEEAWDAVLSPNTYTYTAPQGTELDTGGGKEEDGCSPGLTVAPDSIQAVEEVPGIAPAPT